MLEVLFRHHRALNYYQVGTRCFFSKDDSIQNPYSIGYGKDCVLGFFASLKPAAWKDGSILLNLDSKKFI